MKKFRNQIQDSPLKYYSWLIISFTLFFVGLIAVIGATTLVSFNHFVEVMFNSTNMSVISSFSQTNSSEHLIDMNFLASMITLFGGFGGFCYVFYSIRDGKLPDKEEIANSFEGFLIIILFLDILLFISLISGKWDTPKIFELAFLLVLPCIAIGYGFIFSPIFNSIEENYVHRKSIIEFLKKTDDNIVISSTIDASLRDLVRNFELYSTYIFLLLIGVIFFGIFQNFNPFTIISSILFCLIMYSGFSRLIMLKIPTSNIQLIQRYNSELGSSSEFSDVFILKESSDYITILTNKEDDKKIVSFSKNCVCSIHDNNYEIHEDKQHRVGIWILTRALRIVLIMIAFYIIFKIFGFFFPINRNWVLFFLELIFSLLGGIFIIHVMKKSIDDIIEKVILKFE
jgi:NADH:ubiquinone oxidoreductase subunit K